MTKAKQIERAAAAYVSAPESFAHLEWAWKQFRQDNPGRWPLAVHIHCPVTFVINLETDCAGSA
jgi:hypothetical protein